MKRIAHSAYFLLLPAARVTSGWDEERNMLAAAYSAFPGLLQEVTGLEVRSLEILKHVDQVTTALSVDTRLIEALSNAAVAISERIRVKRPQFSMENIDKLQGGISHVSEGLRQLYQHSMECRRSAERDEDLHEDDCVVEAFDAYLQALHSLYDGFAELSETLTELAVDLEGFSESGYASGDELLLALQG